jgi:hypothetical protein
MMTVQEIERACDNSQLLDFSRHEQQAPELSLKEIFFPHGFPIEVRTNSCVVLELLNELWGKFEQQHDAEPICMEVSVVKGSSNACPPEPSYRIALPLFFAVADADNYSVVDFQRKKAQICLSEAALNHRLYVRYFILGTPVTCISTHYLTPVHAGCVALDGSGVLLCGDSGAGKSTLSYACARKGWTYISDDGSFLVNEGKDRTVTGNCHQIRLRPTAAELFHEIEGLKVTPRAAGKPSVELPTANFPHIHCEDATRVDYIVFLNRRAIGPPKLVPYRKDVARYFMRQVLYGLPETMAIQYEAIERLLTVDVFELRYQDLDWAIDRLRTLVQEGR